MMALGDGRRIERGPWGNGGHWDLSWGWDSVRRHLLIAVRLRHVGVRLLEETDPMFARPYAGGA